MYQETGEFFKFFTTLTPSKMINVVLLGVIIFMMVHSNSVETRLTAERDNFKDRWTEISDKYVSLESKLNDDCSTRFKDYQTKKDAEIKELADSFELKVTAILKRMKK